MAQTRRHVQTYIGVAEYWRLQREAAARGSTISKCAADCLREYFALRAELATAIETPGEPGEPHQGPVIHSLLARSEERLVATLDRRTTEVLGGLRRVNSLLDRLVLMYLIHTPEVPPQLHAGAIASANRRYANFRQAVSDMVAEGDFDGAKDAAARGELRSDRALRVQDEAGSASAPETSPAGAAAAAS